MEGRLQDFLARTKAREERLASFGKLPPLPKDFPKQYSPEVQETLIARLRDHSGNLDNYFLNIHEYPLFDRTSTLSNIEAAYGEFLTLIVPMVEPWLMLTQYEPKTPGLDGSVVSVITQSIQRDSEFTQVEEGVSVLLIQIMTKYQRFHDFRAQLLADEHSVVSDFAKAVQGKVTNLG